MLMTLILVRVPVLLLGRLWHKEKGPPKTTTSLAASLTEELVPLSGGSRHRRASMEYVVDHDSRLVRVDSISLATQGGR